MSSQEVNRVIRGNKSVASSPQEAKVEKCKPYVVKSAPIGMQLRAGQHTVPVMMGPYETVSLTIPGAFPLLMYNVVISDTLGQFTHYLINCESDPTICKVLLQNQSDEQRDVMVVWN